MKKKYKEENKITIIGAGLTGLAFCNLLKDSNIKISIIDSQPKTFYKDVNNERYIVLSNTSKIILENIGLWSKIDQYCTKVKNIHISKQNIFGSTLVKSSDENLDSLGYQLPISNLIKILYENIEKNNNYKFIHEAKATSVNPGDIIKVKYLKNSKEEIIRSDCLIFATGATENLVSNIFSRGTKKDYQQNAVTCEIISDKYNSETAFERFTNEGVLGLIPRKNNFWTLIYSVNKDESKKIKNLEKKILKEYFQNLIGKKCGNIEAVNDIKIYPLQMKYHNDFTDNNICLLGDAAHTLHPIAAQSFNLSLRDCAYLAELIIQLESINKSNISLIFKEYHLKRKSEVKRLIRFTDFLASFIHGKGIIRNNIISASFIFMDMNKKIRVNVIRYLLGVNFSHSLISSLKD